MAIIHARHGKQGRISLNAVNQNLSEWSVVVYAADGDSTNFENQTTNQYGGLVTYETGLTGTTYADVKISGWWDAGNNPFDAGMWPGNPTFGPLNLFVNTVDSTKYTFTLLRVLQASIDESVKGVVPFELTLKSHSTFSFPTGSF